MEQLIGAYQKRDFWIKENLNYVKPHYRLVKAAGIVNKIAQEKECDLLDVGCGPATLMHLLRKNIHYYGIDIAIHNRAPNLIQIDFLENPIGYGDKKFDIVVAQGVFEYSGSLQDEKFREISGLLNEGGTFIASYVNFDHRDKFIYPPYNNVQAFSDFRTSLSRFFRVNRFFPTSHHWHHHEPSRSYMKAIQMHINVNIPLVSRRLAVEYFFICSPKGSSR
jgi:predicted TPR repeat methyltransferase